MIQLFTVNLATLYNICSCKALSSFYKITELQNIAKNKELIPEIQSH